VKEPVLDSSALLALILHERGHERVSAIVDACEGRFAIGSVNFCEVKTRLLRMPETPANVERAIGPFRPFVIDFDFRQAELAADLYPTTASFGLSLRDRACLALAITRGATVWTADRVWQQLNLSIPIELIRP